MSEPLEGQDAYFAGLCDGKTAERYADAMVRRGDVPRENREQILRNELERLWQGRITRGELPPLALDEPELQKAS